MIKEKQKTHAAHSANYLSVSALDCLIKQARSDGERNRYYEIINEIISESRLRTVFHVPHDGNIFPDELMSAVTISAPRFIAYHNAMRDWGVRMLIPEIPRSEVVAFEVSRLLCDVERFIDGSEIMEKYGMGYCYEKVYDGTIIKTVSTEQKEKTLKYYKAHHFEVDEVACKYRDRTLFIDLHSFSEEIIVEDMKSEIKKIPDVCIGYDEKYCPRVLCEIAKNQFIGAGFSVEVNYPYSGSFVPDCILKGDESTPLASIMIEINKSRLTERKKRTADSIALERAILMTVAHYSQVADLDN